MFYSYPEMGTPRLPAAPPGPDATCRASLTPRQRGLLQAIADGLNLVSVAAHFHLTHGTVKSQLYIIRTVLGADTTEQAVAMAIRRGLIH